LLLLLCFVVVQFEQKFERFSGTLSGNIQFQISSKFALQFLTPYNFTVEEEVN